LPRMCSVPSKPPPKSLGDLFKQARDEAPAQPRRPADLTPPLVIRSVALTPAAHQALEALIAHVSAATGRKASASSVVRALLQWAERHDLGDALVQLIAAELQAGEVVWGKRRKR
jgi:hypothetical protein